MGTAILAFLKDKAIIIIIGLALVWLWHDYIGSKESVAVLKTQMAEQSKTIEDLKADMRLRDQVQAERKEASEILGGQINAANRLLDKIKTTPWGTAPLPDDVRGTLRMLEQGRPADNARSVRLPAR